MFQATTGSPATQSASISQPSETTLASQPQAQQSQQLPSTHELSNGQKVAIGVSVGVGVPILLAACAWFFYRRGQRSAATARAATWQPRSAKTTTFPLPHSPLSPYMSGGNLGSPASNGAGPMVEKHGNAWLAPRPPPAVGPPAKGIPAALPHAGAAASPKEAAVSKENGAFPAQVSPTSSNGRPRPPAPPPPSQPQPASTVTSVASRPTTAPAAAAELGAGADGDVRQRTVHELDSTAVGELDAASDPRSSSSVADAGFYGLDEQFETPLSPPPRSPRRSRVINEPLPWPSGSSANGGVEGVGTSGQAKGE